MPRRANGQIRCRRGSEAQCCCGADTRQPRVSATTADFVLENAQVRHNEKSFSISALVGHHARSWKTDRRLTTQFSLTDAHSAASAIACEARKVGESQALLVVLAAANAAVEYTTTSVGDPVCKAGLNPPEPVEVRPNPTGLPVETSRPRREPAETRVSRSSRKSPPRLRREWS